MNKLNYCILGIILFCLSMLIVACQATPEGSFIVSKNDGALDSALETKEPESQTAIESPQRWESTFEKYNGRFAMDIDADIIVPEGISFKVVEVGSSFTSIEQVNEFVTAIFGDEKVYNIQQEITKEQLELEMISIKSEIQAAANKGDAELKQILENRLEWIINTYEDAPDNVVKQPFIGEYAVYKEIGYQEYSVALRKNPADITSPVLQVTNFRNPQKNIYFHSEVTYGDYSIDPFPRYNDADIQSVKYTEHPVFNTTAAINAVIIAEDFLNSVGIDDRTVCDMYALTQTPGAAEIIGYGISFARIFEGVTIMPGIQEGGTYGDIDMSDPDAFIEPFSSERLLIEVIDGEITIIDWTGMFEAINTINENVGLLPFEEIMKNAENQLATKYAYVDEGQASYAYFVDEIVLTYAIEPIKDSKGRYMLIPVWGFYGGVDYGERGYNFLDGTVLKGKVRYNRSLLTANAIDGTIIYGGYEDRAN